MGGTIPDVASSVITGTTIVCKYLESGEDMPTSDDAKNPPKRRGRPPGSKNRTRVQRSNEGEVVDRLNKMVTQLIAENRALRRQVLKVAARARGDETKSVEKGLRVISRRVERALVASKAVKRRRASAGNGRRRRG